MKVLQIQNYTNCNYNSPKFEAKGKPLALKVIIDKHSERIPQRVLELLKEFIRTNPNEHVSLLDLHKEIYAPLLECESLEQVKSLFPEFSNIKKDVSFARDSVYTRAFKEKAGDKFSLRMIQELWANLKTKDEVAKEMGMKSRSSIDWALKQIDFVYFPANYRTILKASDEVGNKEIASKTIAWNAAHPDLMRKKNKHAAQFCKTEKYRKEQSQRMLEYDKLHPERRQKIAEADKKAWELCDAAKIMSEFAMTEPPYIRKIMTKFFAGLPLTEFEKRIKGGFFTRFWKAHPEAGKMLSEAKEKVRKLNSGNKQ